VTIGVRLQVGMSSKVTPSSFYGFLSICLVIEFDEDWCMNLIGIFLGVVTFGVFPHRCRSSCLVCYSVESVNS
jgi:hypothetical protein